MIAAAIAISPRTAPLLVLAGTGVVFLYGVWLLSSSSARSTTLAERGGLDLSARPTFVQRLDRRLARTPRGVTLASRLRAAGVELTAGQFLVRVLGAALAAYLLVSLVWPRLIAIVAAIVAAWAGFAWLGRRLEKRGEQFIAQLPEVARLLSGGASAGLSIPAALELTVREIERPARDELQTVLDEIGLGRSLEDALDGLRRRLPSREIAVLMSTLIIQQRSGGDTVRALRDLSDTLDKRRETNREVRTIMAGAVYTAYFVPFLGLFSLVLLNSIRPGTLQTMTSNPIGIVVLVVAGIAYSIAFVLLKRITRIEV